MTFSILLSIFVRLLACSFPAVGECPCVRAACHCWKSHELKIDLFKDVPMLPLTVLGECCPSGRDSSLNLLVLIFVSGA